MSDQLCVRRPSVELAECRVGRYVAEEEWGRKSVKNNRSVYVSLPKGPEYKSRSAIKDRHFCCGHMLYPAVDRQNSVLYKRCLPALNDTLVDENNNILQPQGTDFGSWPQHNNMRILVETICCFSRLQRNSTQKRKKKHYLSLEHPYQLLNDNLKRPHQTSTHLTKSFLRNKSKLKHHLVPTSTV